jgi:RHS repeat-associated protein
MPSERQFGVTGVVPKEGNQGPSTVAINLPKGGGAIRGIGEKFTANPVTGTGSFSVPIATSPGRSGYSPQLALQYDSGAGNGPFGLGWSLSLAQIARKTDKGLPQYRDHEGTDVFIFSGLEDLVPVLIKNGNNWTPENLPLRTVNGASYQVQRYRPRIEGGFERIERWSNTLDNTDVFWRCIGRDNTKTWYGTTSNSRIAEPSDPSRVFAWLICHSCDDKGNAIVYEYAEENSQGIDISAANEANRTELGRSANRYIKRIKYGNQASILKSSMKVPPTGPDFSQTTWMFEVVFDYDEGHYMEQPPDTNGTVVAQATATPTRAWTGRRDPFSSHRATFEVRTYRLCRRALMFHHIPSGGGLTGYDGLVRSTEFTYGQTSSAAFITQVAQSGYLPLPSAANQNTFTKKSLPPLEFDYSRSPLDDRPGTPFQDNFELQDIDPDSLENLPVGLDGARYEWLDLDGEGISGILTEQAGGWFYKPNLGGARFGPVQSVCPKPSLQRVEPTRTRFLDLTGDGRIDLVELNGMTPGYFARAEDFQWQPFKPFKSLPNLPWPDPNLQFVDLTGDGLPDVLITDGDKLRWCASLGEEGFGPINWLDLPPDEERGPRLLVADGTISVFLADMTGDGLADLVRITWNEVCFWPNQGYGRFGMKVVLDNVPMFDTPDQFDGQRIRFADTDGSGTTDIIYLGPRAIGIYLNQAGNSLSAPRFLNCLPRIDNHSSVYVVDLLGAGTACMVISSPFSGSRAPVMRYVDLMQGQKPHLLVRAVNNFGAETNITYTPSTQFYLADKLAGSPWATRLPFPVHCVSKVVLQDHLRETIFTASYTYHHGYYDRVEREFRGFGRVEQLDTEDYAAFRLNDAANVVEQDLHQPPVLTRTWFHTGVFFSTQDRVLHQFGQEYFQNQQRPEPVLPEPQLPDGLTTDECIEAFRALKGLMLHQEVYAQDGNANEKFPYGTSSATVDIKLVQPRAFNPYASFLVIPAESISCAYERNPADARITHAFTLETDEYGLVIKSVTVAYPRGASPLGLPPEVQTAQAQMHVVYAETDYTNDVIADDDYRIRVPNEGRAYELTGLSPGAGGYLSADDIAKGLAGAAPIPFETPASSGLQQRLISQNRTLFLNDDLSGPLALGALGVLGLVCQSFRKAFTTGLVTQQFGSHVSDAMFVGAGYVHAEGDKDWWIPSGTFGYAADAQSRFYLPDNYTDPLGTQSNWERDNYDLLTEGSTDALGNQTRADNDYRTLSPWQVTDLNQNRSAVATDELGVVIKSAVMGKLGANQGDTLADPTSRMEYDLFDWANHQKPAFVHVFNREQHGAANPRWQESYVYFDGMGGVIMTKSQAAPGLAKQWDESTQKAVDVDTSPNVRWVGNGRVVMNNKGSPVKQYEPYFSVTPAYEDAKELVETGVTPILYYDPLGRNVRGELPNGTLIRLQFDPWSQSNFDANDTTLESQWYADRGSPDPSGPEPKASEQRAAWLAARHANTPAVLHSDTLGRVIYAVADNGSAGKRVARSELDLTGHVVRVFDNRNRLVTQGVTNMVGAPIYAESAERGERWAFMDVLGNPVRLWDYAGRAFSASFDILHRPLSIFYQEGNKNPILFSRIVYGELQTSSAASNLRGRPCLLYDQAGVATLLEFDFKGNLLGAQRRFTKIDQGSTPGVTDWGALKDLSNATDVAAAAEAQLELELYAGWSQFDALNRPIKTTLPDGTVLRPTFNEANYPATIAAQIRGQGTFTTFLAGQDYDAKGQRQYAKYGNSLITRYTYDPVTFRLTNLLTLPASAAVGQNLQDLSYSYDPVGNITQISDDAQPTNYFRNAVVQPKSLFQYDALYQLVKATGREQASTGASPQPNNDDLPFNDLPHPNDLQAVRVYAENYSYDDLGNILSVQHVANGGSWTRNYSYLYQNDPTNRTNRLGATSLPSDPPAGPYSAKYTHDTDGRMTIMPQVTSLTWNFLDQLQSANLGGGGTASYIYASSGQRMRKIIQRNGATRTERRYLGGIEVYREYKNTTLTLERWTAHISDNTGRIAQVDTKTVDTANADDAPLNSGVVRYQYGNHLESAILETDDQGVAISYEEYHPFGTTAYHSAKPGVNHSLKRYRFSGKERDEETGFYYFGARYYAAWLGRWTSCDPAGFVDGINIFGYCRNNPIGARDRNGMKGEREPTRVHVERTADPPFTGKEDPKSVFAGEIRDLEKIGKHARIDAEMHFEPGGRYDPESHSFAPGGTWVLNATIKPAPHHKAAPPPAPPTAPPPPPPAPAAPAAPAPAPSPPVSNPAGAAPSLPPRQAIQPGPVPPPPMPLEPIPKIDLPQALPGTNFRAAEAAGRAAARQVYTFGPGEQAQHYLKWREGQKTNLDPNITNDTRYMGPLQSRNALSQGPYTANGRTFGNPHKFADQGRYPENEAQVQRSWGPYTTNRVVHVEAGRRTMRDMTGNRGPMPPYIVGPTILGAAGHFALAATRAFVPLVAEAELGLMGAGMTLSSWGFTAAGATVFGAAAYVPVVGGGLVAGAFLGNAAESFALEHGASEEMAQNVGMGAAALGGAAVGALIGSVIPGVGTAIGAGLGALAGMIGYGLSKWF